MVCASFRLEEGLVTPLIASYVSYAEHHEGKDPITFNPAKVSKRVLLASGDAIPMRKWGHCMLNSPRPSDAFGNLAGSRCGHTEMNHQTFRLAAMPPPRRAMTVTSRVIQTLIASGTVSSRASMTF